MVIPPSRATLRATIHWAWSDAGPREQGFLVATRRLHAAFLEVADSGRWLVEGDGWRIHSAPGQVLVVPADRAHRMRQTEPGTTRSRWWAVTLLDPLHRDLLATPRAGWLLDATASRETIRLLEAGDAPAGASTLELLDAAERATRVVRIALAACPDPPAPTAPVEDRIARVLAHVEAHLAEPLPRGALARIAHLSQTRFSDVFTAALGTSPGAYVIGRRMHRARELLLAGDAAISEVAAACGFPDPARFSREFHRRTGRSPTGYRRQFRGGVSATGAAG